MLGFLGVRFRGGSMSTNSSKSILLASDQQRSVLNALEADRPCSFAYSPYGHRPWGHGLLSLLGFNGELPDPLTGHYHLGNGYRQFNPVLMRFNSTDSWSPFGEGGLNAYGYCGGDPINRQDPTGHTFAWLKSVLREVGLMSFPNQRAIMARPASPLPPPIAQIQTQKNVKLPSRGDLTHEDIPRLRYRVETEHQDRVFQLELNPDVRPRRTRSRVQVDGKEVTSKRAYSKLVARHQNATQTPVDPKRQKSVTFAVDPYIYEVERYVPQPARGWTTVASIRK